MQEKVSVPAIRFAGFTDDWEQRKLGEVCAVSSGVMGDSLLTEGQYHLTRIETIADGVVDEKRVGYSNQKPDESYLLNAGDILYSNINSISHMGKVAKYQGNSVLYHGINLLRLRPSVDVDSEFLLYLLNTESRRNWAKAHANQAVSQASINQSLLESQEIMTCKKDEQIQIGAFFRHLDHLITLHQRKYTCLSNIKKSMLEKMFPKNGVVVPEIRFVGFTDDWEQRKVSEVSEIVAGGTPSTSVLEYWEPKEVPWLSSGEVHKKYIINTDDMISKSGLANSSAKMIKENSVLIALAGQGKTRGTVAINRISLSTNQSIAAITFNNDIISEFAFSNLENRYDEIRAMSSGDGSRGGLNKKLVGDIVIPYTNREEQRKIGLLFQYLDHLITLHQRELERLQNIKKSCLEKMFV